MGKKVWFPAEPCSPLSPPGVWNTAFRSLLCRLTQTANVNTRAKWCLDFIFVQSWHLFMSMKLHYACILSSINVVLLLFFVFFHCCYCYYYYISYHNCCDHQHLTSKCLMRQQTGSQTSHYENKSLCRLSVSALVSAHIQWGGLMLNNIIGLWCIFTAVHFNHVATFPI